jgi:CheY-like chemotaxis protein
MTDKPAILYVEDDRLSRKLMEMLLRGRMQLPHVTILEDSEDFMLHVGRLDPKPNIVLLDIHVKPFDGFEMLAMLRQLDWGKNTPIIALTASVMNEEIQKLTQAGFNGCIGKPIDIKAVPEALERILNGEAIWRVTY